MRSGARDNNKVAVASGVVGGGAGLDRSARSLKYGHPARADRPSSAAAAAEDSWPDASRPLTALDRKPDATLRHALRPTMLLFGGERELST